MLTSLFCFIFCALLSLHLDAAAAAVAAAVAAAAYAQFSFELLNGNVFQEGAMHSARRKTRSQQLHQNRTPEWQYYVVLWSRHQFRASIGLILITL